MAPIVHGLEYEYYGRMNFVYLDIDDPANDNFESQLGFRYQPQMFLLDGNGNILQEWIGPVAEADLRAAFEANLTP